MPFGDDAVRSLLDATLPLMQAPPVNLGVICRWLGIEVYAQPCRAFGALFLLREGRGVLLVNSSLPQGRARFSIAHELGHPPSPQPTRPYRRAPGSRPGAAGGPFCIGASDARGAAAQGLRKAALRGAVPPLPRLAPGHADTSRERGSGKSLMIKFCTSFRIPRVSHGSIAFYNDQ